MRHFYSGVPFVPKANIEKRTQCISSNLFYFIMYSPVLSKDPQDSQEENLLNSKLATLMAKKLLKWRKTPVNYLLL